MKNFELKLGSTKETLTREQMKKIIGGNMVLCLWEMDKTNPDCAGTTYVQCDGGEDYCQGYMDYECEVSSCCSDVTC